MKKIVDLAKKVLIIIGLLAVIGCVFGRGSSNDDTKKKESTQSAETQVTESNESGNSEKKSAAEKPDDKKAEDKVEPKSEADETEIRQDFKEAMDSYEAFYDEYVEFMKKYNADPTNAELMAGYAELLVREADMTRKFDAWESEDMTTAESAYYLEVQSRVIKKLSEIA